VQRQARKQISSLTEQMSGVINLRRFLMALVGTTLGLALSACLVGRPPTDASPYTESMPVVTAWTAQASTQTFPVSPSAAPTTTIRPVHTVYFTPTPTPIIVFETPVPIALSIEACSPLEAHSWADLQEIVSFPYDPPPPGKDTGHHGVDFSYYRRGDRLSILGVPIQSVLAGETAAVILDRPPYGNMVIIETRFEQIHIQLVEMLAIEPGESLYLLYAHMDQAPLPGLGEPVGCGQVIGEVGNTPPEWSSAPHLHFEGRVGPPGERFGGMAYYDTSASLEELENYRRWRMSGEFRLFDPMLLLAFGLADPAVE
jgi:murein DD-endopeptidase MepM/ murein hydrolase activator NlpD